MPEQQHWWYCVDRGGLTEPGKPRRVITLITYRLFASLPDGTRLYDSYGNTHHKGQPETEAFMSGYAFRDEELTLMGLPSTPEDLQHEGGFWGPYRDR